MQIISEINEEILYAIDNTIKDKIEVIKSAYKKCDIQLSEKEIINNAAELGIMHHIINGINAFVKGVVVQLDKEQKNESN